MTKAREIEPLDMRFEGAVRMAIRTPRPVSGKVEQGQPDRQPDMKKPYPTL